MDQRGAGRSTPLGCLESNTTQDLVDDIESLRSRLGVEKWQVFGGSWGSTLALAYAQAHPRRVSSLVLRGIFLLRRKEARPKPIEFFYGDGGGASCIWPDEYEAFRKHIPPAERHDMVGAYHRRLTSGTRESQLAAATAWTGWEMATSYLEPNAESRARAADPAFALSFARIEAHYFVHGGFLESDGALLAPERIESLRGIPTTIVQGRYDVVCPMMSAWELHRALPEAELKITLTGHSANEPEIISELVKATDRYRQGRREWDGGDGGVAM